MIQASQPLTPRQQAIYDLFVTGDASLIQFSRTSRRLYDWYKRGIEGLSKPVGCTIEAAAWLAGRDTTARKAQATARCDIDRNMIERFHRAYETHGQSGHLTTMRLKDDMVIACLEAAINGGMPAPACERCDDTGVWPTADKVGHYCDCGAPAEQKEG